MARGRKRSKRRSGRGPVGHLGEPAHVARVVVGGIKQDGKTRVTDDEVRRLVEMSTSTTHGAATVVTGSGRWWSPTSNKLYDEPSTVIEVVGSARNSCARLHRRMRAVAARAASK